MVTLALTLTLNLTLALTLTLTRFAMVIPNVYPAFLKSALRLHAEVHAA